MILDQGREEMELDVGVAHAQGERMKPPASRCELAARPSWNGNQRRPILTMLCGRIASRSVTGSVHSTWK